MLRFLSNLAEYKTPWFLLFLFSFGLLLSALYFQHINDLQPCVKCIYQRTAVIGILLASLPPMLVNNLITRLIGFVGWGVAAVWGLLAAYEHVDIQTAANPFFATCELIPNFPAWAPLHEWLPVIFGATGECGDINWQFLDLSMPQWMLIIFACYGSVLLVVLLARIANKRFI